MELELNDIYHLKVGDVIDLNKPKNSSVKLYVGRQPWFIGQMGIYKKNIAVRISGRTYESQEEDGTEGAALEQADSNVQNEQAAI